MADLCDDGRFELIEKYKLMLMESTNINNSEDELKVLDTILFRFWQMGWLDKLEQPSAQQWIPCKTRLPEEYGEYRVTWVTSAAPGKRYIGDAEFEVTSVWDNEHNGFKGEWLLDEYIKNYPDVEVLAWKPLEDPWEGEP